MEALTISSTMAKSINDCNGHKTSMWRSRFYICYEIERILEI